MAGPKPSDRVLIRHRRERHGHRGEATWRPRQRREGGRHQPRDGRPEPPEAGRGREDPPLETVKGAQPWDPLTSDVWSPGEGGCLSFKPPVWCMLLRPPRDTDTVQVMRWRLQTPVERRHLGIPFSLSSTLAQVFPCQNKNKAPLPSTSVPMPSF